MLPMHGKWCLAFTAVTQIAMYCFAWQYGGVCERSEQASKQAVLPIHATLDQEPVNKTAGATRV